MTSNTSENYNSQESLSGNTLVGSGPFAPDEKTQITSLAYKPSDDLLQKYNELYRELSNFNMENCPVLLDPESMIVSDRYKENLDATKSWFESGIKALEASTERELKDVNEQKAYWEERMENDKNHLESLIKAKEETNFSKSVDKSKHHIPTLFHELTHRFRELKVDDKKKLQETYTRVLSYVQNKPSKEGSLCEFCSGINDAYQRVQTRFQKEDKWVHILDDQMLVCKLRTENKHNNLDLGDAVYNDVVKTAKDLHLLCFAFNHLLVFSMDEKQELYTSVKYDGELINLDIFRDDTSAQKPNEKKG